ncbi:hypothetical protein SARC_08994 [Sphaeroforma arctica JP610]|uniref:TehB/YeaR-like domain-containing protein n=1 Tax=Sphaeroforma arctica JP610 TaxID=667725 RepID=A0A0L0FP72_9EUKA|nr:hypothetical protein SARC_08994 [Sphaeroforma arctica JP610]KNC78577.1 hypothetical protein SARC_08994 [Sphaeroforma arctica JP610]|eukprot:XP_014152479.1 hypothetical protein SARC_08994 [Sphaeroforma arctica JP610]
MEKPVWTQNSLPRAFQLAHNTKAGTWGVLSVTSGSVDFTFLDGKSGPALHTYTINAGERCVIEPQQYHKVVPTGEVECQLVFHRCEE